MAMLGKWRFVLVCSDAGGMAVCEAGAIPPLVDVLRQCSEEAKATAARALAEMETYGRFEAAVRRWCRK